MLTTHADKWDIKAAFAPKASAKYDLNITVVQGGEDHTAVMKYGITLKDTAKDKPLEGTYTWTDLMLDGGQAVPDQTWDVTFDTMGGIATTDAQEGEDAIRSMLMPISFIYPDKAVEVGDTWTETLKAGTTISDRSMTCEMKAEAMEKVGDVDTLKVTEKISQKGDTPLTATGTWWVDKDGKVLKFEVKTTNWYVPMAGDALMDATFTGTLAK